MNNRINYQSLCLQEFVRTLSEQFYETFQIPADGYIPFAELFERFSQELALKLACNAGNEKCLADTFNVNRHFIEDGIAVPKGLEGVILCSGFRGTGKQTQWIQLFNTMQAATTDATLRTQILNALGCTDDVDSLKSYLESTVAVGNTYTQTERQNVFSAVLNSRSGLSAVIDFINNFELDILRLLNYATLEDVLNVPARTIKTRDQQELFVNFVETLTNLEGTNSSRITTIINNNFQVQEQPRYANSIEFIGRYLSDQTSTVEITTQTQAPTVPTPVPTQPTEPTTPESTTPSGATTIGLQIATIFASLFIIFTLKM